MFEDLPPGVEGYGGPTSLAAAATAADGIAVFPGAPVNHLPECQPVLAPGPSYQSELLHDDSA